MGNASRLRRLESQALYVTSAYKSMQSARPATIITLSWNRIILAAFLMAYADEVSHSSSLAVSGSLPFIHGLNRPLFTGSARKREYTSHSTVMLLLLLL